MENGLRMCNEKRREDAGATLVRFYRKWFGARATARRTAPAVTRPSPSPARPAPTPALPKTRGRPRKTKRNSGGGRNKRARLSTNTSTSKPRTAKEKKAWRQMQDRLSCWEFQSPPPFQPKLVGRKRIGSVGPIIYVGGRQHALVHAGTLGLWKNPQGRCACCYAMAPPAKGGKKYMQDGSLITRTNFACNVCKQHLCDDCHHYTWPLHFANTSNTGLPRSIVFSSRNV